MKKISNFINQSHIKWQDRTNWNKTWIVLWLITCLTNVISLLPINHLEITLACYVGIVALFDLFMMLLEINNRTGIKAGSLHHYTSNYVKSSDITKNMDALIASEETWLKNHNSLDDLALYKQHQQNLAVIKVFTKNLDTLPTTKKWNE